MQLAVLDIGAKADRGLRAAYLAAIQAVPPSFGVELTPLGARDAAEIERDVTAFARVGKGGLIVTRTSEPITQRDAQWCALAQTKVMHLSLYRSGRQGTSP